MLLDEDTRVKLAEISKKADGYINANYIEVRVFEKFNI